MLEQLDTMRAEALAAVREASDEGALDAVVGRYLGRKGSLQEILRGIGGLPPDQRGPVGKGANELKQALEQSAEARRAELLAAREAGLGDAEWVDATLPPPADLVLTRTGGTLHPITQMIRELEDVFLGLGFELFQGPWAEDDHHNFGALNIPADHPARDMHDTFWLSDGHLLRTHTSPVQIRAMETREPPIRGVAIGRVFRHEEVDATHEMTFHQCEGLYVDRNVSAGHLRWVLEQMLAGVLARNVEIRFRPSYFPFVEPGFEVDVKFKGKWLELLGSGMVHPRVLEAGGLDPTVWSGFAFGVGVDRLVMLRHEIEDLRQFMGGDLRFLQQFSEGVEA